LPRVDSNKKIYKELKGLISRLEAADSELTKLGNYEELFSKDFASIRMKLKAPAHVNKVESELHGLKAKVKQHKAEVEQGKVIEAKAVKAVQVAESDVKKAIASGYIAIEADKLAKRANTALEKKDYTLAEKHASDAVREAARIIKEARPDVSIEMKEASYKPGEWKAVDLIIQNKGTVNAKDIKLQFSEDIDVNWYRDIPKLDAGAKETLRIGLKPKETGDVPLDIKYYYNDITEKSYSGDCRFWLRVGANVSGDKVLTDIALPRISKELNRNYKVMDAIGFGGFSDVYKATRKKDKVIVALKIPRFNRFTTVEPDMFMEEASIWSKLKHENIIPVYEYGAKPYPWIAMEYMEGGSLREKIGGLTIKESVSILLKICEALYFAHHMGIVHRDMKPDNVLFDKDGVPKVGDWGLGRMMIELSTQSGAAGTPAYSAPEQIDPRKYGNTGWWTDIYQLAAMAYEMVTGKTPYVGETTLELAMNIVTQEFVAPSTINSEIPKELDDVLVKALSKNKDDRYRDIWPMIDELKKVEGIVS
jgi:tRNA A-37 threonylcarbamoyl transferase component Bud32